jgi:hypothetical protein
LFLASLKKQDVLLINLQAVACLLFMISESYVNVASRIPTILEAVQKAGVPSRFTIEFLRSLGFKSTNDRAIISVLKGIGFLDASGTPTDRYRAYKNKSDGGKVLAAALRESYEDIFLADEDADKATTQKIAGIFATRTGKGDAVTRKQAATFKALTTLADFSDDGEIQSPPVLDKILSPENPLKPKAQINGTDFHYNIQIHLPATKDISIYNAIFKSLREYLL